jgi:hypothetical protein
MAITQYYVDPSINANSGTGTIGDPFGDLQYALDSVTRNSTDGDRFNVKSGTAENISSALSTATYGNGTASAPLIIQGYTSVAGDGGRGVVDGGSVSSYIFSNGSCTIHFADMDLQNVTFDVIGSCGQHSHFIRCKIANATYEGITCNYYTRVLNCEVSGCGRYGVLGSLYSFIHGNYIDCSSGTAGILLGGRSQATKNIITGNPTTASIIINTSINDIVGNSILASASTAKGIYDNGSNQSSTSVFNNIIEGFSGTGGVGIDFSSNTEASFVDFNASYDNATDYSLGSALYTSNNEVLTASGFAKIGSNTYANRFTYFEPVDTGNLHGGAFPSGSRVDKGAIQHADPSGGGGSQFHPLG